MRAKYLLSLMILPAVIAAGFYAQPVSAQGFVAGRIIDDGKFTAKSSMSISQIQTFLNNKVPTCDTNGQQLSEFGGPDLNGDGRVQRWEWGQSNYNQTVFTCLKNYRENNKSAAQIIYDTSQEFSISPKVMLVLLQKEQALVTDTWPLNIQYRSATGYGCPDTAACDSEYYGFTNQVRWAARMFRAIMNDSPTWYTPYNLGNNYIQYNPDPDCGGSTVLIQNRATQALYNYTPYQPNSAALAAGWGTAPCGAYGNRNFFLYYTHWFGSPLEGKIYSWYPTSQSIYTDSGRTTKLQRRAVMEPGKTYYATITAQNNGNQAWPANTTRLATSEPNDRTSKFSNETWPKLNRPVFIDNEVKPGEQVELEFELTAPEQAGTYKEYFNIVIEGARWVRDPGMYYYITVRDTRNTSFYSDSNYTNMVSNENLVIYENEQLYGRTSILNNTETVIPEDVRLATTQPYDRSSLLQHDSWWSQNRVARLVSPIAAGADGTIDFTISAPSVANSGVIEHFGLVNDGVAWLENDTLSLRVSVKSRPSDTLINNQSTGPATIRSKSQEYRLVLQSDGNLVLYSSTKALWSSRTVGSNANRLSMQSDGNLVLYSPSGPVWATHTQTSGARRLVLQDDGNLVVYTPKKAIWATGTHR